MSAFARRPRRAGSAAVAALCALATACSSAETAVDVAPQASSPQARTFFVDAQNVWTTPVAPDARVDPRSKRYVERLDGLKPVISLREFSVPIFVADTGTQRYSISPTAAYAPAGTKLDDVPIPPGAAADPGTDGHMAVFDPTDSCIYEFYRAKQSGNGWTAEWVNATPSDGSGIYPDGLSTRAAGVSITAGLIWPDELRAGEINHALVFAYPFTRKGGPVPPATRSDGESTDPAALPEGAHLRLDPAVDVNALPISNQDKVIARALQRYGMILVDTSGGFTLFAVNPLSFSADPYNATWGDTVWADISGIPFDRMQVLASGEQQDPYTGPPIGNRCNQKGK